MKITVKNKKEKSSLPQIMKWDEKKAIIIVLEMDDDYIAAIILVKGTLSYELFEQVVFDRSELLSKLSLFDGEITLRND